MVHMWSGNERNYKYSEFVDFCHTHPLWLKFFTLMLGDLKIYDREFRRSDKWFMMRTYARCCKIFILWEIIKYIPNYFEELYWFITKGLPILVRRAKKKITAYKTNTSKRLRASCSSNYYSSLDFWAEFEDEIFTWHNYLLVLKEWVRLCFRAGGYLMFLHLIFTTREVQIIIHHYFYTNFNYIHILSFYMLALVAHAFYRYWIYENNLHHIRPYVRETIRIKYDYNRFVFFVKGCSKSLYIYLKALNKKWREEDIILDNKIIALDKKWREEDRILDNKIKLCLKKLINKFKFK